MPKRSLISAIFYSIRPSACIGAAFFATASLSKYDDFLVVALTFIASFIGGAGCFLINDIYEREKDLKNNKLRPIATGELPVRTAFNIAVICCIFMLMVSIYLSLNTFLLAILLIVGFWLYPFINQRFGLLANLWVSVCSSLAFLFGGLVYEITPIIYIAMLASFFVNIGREILLDSFDQVGDQAVGKPSIPLIYGQKKMKVIVLFFYALGSIVFLKHLQSSLNEWPWIVSMLILLWFPFFIRRDLGFRKWALFNVRLSHFFFAILITFLFIRNINFSTVKQDITANYCLGMLEKLQSKEDGFYPKGIFPTKRTWITREEEEDNNVFGTAWIAYILRSSYDRLPNERSQILINQAIYSFEDYRNRYRESSYNFYPTVGVDLPFPNSIILSREQYRFPDDYDDTALIQLARGFHPMNQPVRDKMLKYALRPERKVVKPFASDYRSKKIYEVWYAKNTQGLDIVVMANVMLFVFEKGYSLQTTDQLTIECLKTSIEEGWYFKDPAGYAENYNRPALILYSLARMVAKDRTNEFIAQRKILIQHLRKALNETDQAIEKVMIASSLRRLGESVNLELHQDEVMQDAKSFAFTSGLLKPMLPLMYWRSEALSWALVYELLSFEPNINWN